MSTAVSSGSVRVNKKATIRVEAGHLWIYKSDLERPEGVEPGATVEVWDFRGRYLGRAFYSSTSQIALRLLTTHESEPADEAFFRKKIRAAAERREPPPPGTEAYRLVNAEGDGLPSIIVDRFVDILVFQTLSQGADKVKPWIEQILKEEFHPRAIVERNDAGIRELEGLDLKCGLVYGEIPEEIIYKENDVQFIARLLEGQKTGTFLDQRENHLMARRYARGIALDCFTYAGGFALNIAGRSEHVLAIDSSASAVELGERNARLNGVMNVQFKESNVFDELKALDTMKARFDTIVLDPPAFAKKRTNFDNAMRGYKEINLRAMKMLAPGGVLISCSCSQHVSEIDFLNLLAGAAADARRHFAVIEKTTQSSDHPFLLSMPETLYLKCVVLRAVE
ncbi:MAG: class I SAM-dependent rRNA methyltransferase [Acidobacteriia bacterium]|nr:class I SAM-dependent rRNA methyltransferase [Terriglobia bacterium]